MRRRQVARGVCRSPHLHLIVAYLGDVITRVKTLLELRRALLNETAPRVEIVVHANAVKLIPALGEHRITAGGRLPWVVLPRGHRVFAEAGDWRPDYVADPSRLEG